MANSETASRADGTPRWVKIFGVVVVLFLILLVVGFLLGGHGPGLHSP